MSEVRLVKGKFQNSPRDLYVCVPMGAFENPATKFGLGYLDCWGFLVKLIMYLFCSLQWYVVQSAMFLGKIHCWGYCETAFTFSPSPSCITFLLWWDTFFLLSLNFRVLPLEFKKGELQFAMYLINFPSVEGFPMNSDVHQNMILSCCRSKPDALLWGFCLD